eukprot:3347332-Ditylum_brightwellii.AAC.1
MEGSLGYDIIKNCPLHKWLGEGLKSQDGKDKLHKIFYWVTKAMSLHGHVTLLTLIIVNTIHDINFMDNRQLAGDNGKQLKCMCQMLLCTIEYREKEMKFKKMQENGTFPSSNPNHYY